MLCYVEMKSLSFHQLVKPFFPLAWKWNKKIKLLSIFFFFFLPALFSCCPLVSTTSYLWHWERDLILTLRDVWKEKMTRFILFTEELIVFSFSFNHFHDCFFLLRWFEDGKKIFILKSWSGTNFSSMLTYFTSPLLTRHSTFLYDDIQLMMVVL